MKKWKLLSNNDYKAIKEKYKLSEVLSRIISNRRNVNINKLDDYFYSNKDKMYNPFLLDDMEKAIIILNETIANNEKILIVGDYDQDGIASVVILMKGISKVYKNIIYDIPNRINDGYGINKRIIEEAEKNDVKLIITCDNGSMAFEAIEYANKVGIKVIITDHHQVEVNNKENILPKADAIINPHKLFDKYPFKDLCGAGIAYKFIVAFYINNNLNLDEIYYLLQYAAMGTICDVVSLVDENRIIVKEGLNYLNKSSETGINLLIKKLNINTTIDEGTLGFLIGPTINSVGRLLDSKIAVELFLEKELDKIKEYADVLVDTNNKRKVLTQEAELLIRDKIDINEDIIIEWEKNIHESIAGIIAGKLKEKYNKPTIILTQSKIDDIWKGSGRSIEGVDLFQLLEENKELLYKHGGHQMAVGLSIKDKNLEQFKNNIINTYKVDKESKFATINIDIPINIKYINEILIESLDILKPFGKDNEEPIFFSKELNVKDIKILGKNKNALKFKVYNDEACIDGIMFSNIDYYNEILTKKTNSTNNNLDDKKVNIVYTPQINSYKNKKTFQLRILDLQ